jgi:Domain of unknown function (DUF4377)
MKPALALVLLTACTEHGSTPIQTAIVAPLRVPCQGFGPVMCLSMVPVQKPTELVFFGIEGYTHRWGVESEITFRREVLDQPIPDGPSENLILIDTVVENETITAPFDLSFQGGFGFFSGTGTQLDMLGTTVECDQAIGNQISTASSSGVPFQVTMELTDDPQTLRALAVTQE